MFGISLGKIVFTVLVVVVVWWGFKTVARRHAAMTGKPRESAAERAARSAREAVRATMERRGDGGGDAAPVEELEQCPKCGTYKARGAQCACEKVGG